jgi:outer membrane protein
MHKITNYIKVFTVGCCLFTNSAFAQQEKTITLQEAIHLGINNSKTLQLSKAKVDAAVSRYKQTLENALPTGNVALIYNHAEIPAHTLQFGAKPLVLPDRADAYLGTFSLQELIFAGNKLKYAKESTSLQVKAAELDTEKDKDDLTLNIISTYYNLYKLDKGMMIADQNIDAVQSEIKQSKRLFDQGLITKNDLLRLQLQLSNIQITKSDIDKNQKIVNYNFNILLGLPEITTIKVNQSDSVSTSIGLLSNYVDSAFANRAEVKSSELRTQVAASRIKSIRANTSPTLSAGLNAYYINPSGNIFPSASMFVAPITVGATLSWNFATLWTNKNKIAEANIAKRESEIGQQVVTDQLKNEVNYNYQNYLAAVRKIDFLSASIDQATENNKIVQSKYQNSTASITDRIDADTLLFQSKLNMEIAKADAQLAYYNLLKVAGELHN